MSRHNAPSVVYPVQRSLTLGSWLLAVWGLGLCILALWTLSSTAWGWRASVAAVAAAGTALAALMSWRASRCGQLAWDGQRWHWDSLTKLSSSEQSQLSVIVDVQFALLLSFEAISGTRCWLWVERESQPERWMDLRRAVYSAHRTAIPLEASSSSMPSTVEKLSL